MISKWFKFKKLITKLFVQDRGGIAIVTGLLLIVCIGFAALAIDVGIWYDQKRKLQLAADAGAAGGVIALTETGKSSINTYATHDIVLNGCTSDNNCTIVAINNPPQSGPNAANQNAVEVILSKPTSLYLSGIFLSVAPTLHVRAVGTAGPPDNNCFLTLGTDGIRMVGTSNITAPNCSVYSNSGISGVGGSLITANKVSATGTITASVTAPGGTFPGSPILPDPFASLKVPSFSGCGTNNYSGTPTTISPGVYCGGFSVNGGTVTMNPGTYIINGGSFSLNGGATLNGNGVTLIFTSTTGSYPDISIAGGNTLNLTAPTSGPFNGIAMFEDRNAPSPSITFAGGTNFLVDGAMYFPSGDIKFTGNSNTSGNSCLQLISSSITVKGNSAVTSNCSPPGTPTVRALVE